MQYLQKIQRPFTLMTVSAVPVKSSIKNQTEVLNNIQIDDYGQPWMTIIHIFLSSLKLHTIIH